MDSIIIASEALHSINKEKLQGLSIKLDVSKSYDRVKWRVMIKVMEQMGFCKEWLSMIYYYLLIARYLVLVNNISSGFFQSTNELRQGDPI